MKPALEISNLRLAVQYRLLKQLWPSSSSHEYYPLNRGAKAQDILWLRVNIATSGCTFCDWMFSPPLDDERSCLAQKFLDAIIAQSLEINKALVNEHLLKLDV